MPTDDLVTILEYLRERFPRIERITTYARARTLKRKSVEDLSRLKEAGLNRVHAGLESGSEKVLKLIKKGSTQEEIITGGRHVMDAGLELSEYVMPGIGGLALSEEHAHETARVLNLIRPHFIRVRTFAMHPKSPMQRMVREGTFVPMNDEQTVAEIRLFVGASTRCTVTSRATISASTSSCRSMAFSMRRRPSCSRRARYVPVLLEEAEADIYPLCSDRATTVTHWRSSTDQRVVDQVMPEIEKLEKEGEDAFDRYIDMLKSYQLPQPQTEDWN